MRRWLEFAVADHPIQFFLTLAGLVASLLVAWIIVSTDPLPSSVRVQVAQSEHLVEVSGVVFTIDRVAFHEQFKVREVGDRNFSRIDGGTVGSSSGSATVYIDGAVINESAEDVFFLAQKDSEEIVSSPWAQIQGDERLELIVRMGVSGPTCSQGDGSILLEAGETERIHMEIDVEGDRAWLLNDVKGGSIQAITIGRLSRGSCDPMGNLSIVGVPWNVEFAFLAFNGFQLQSYFPIGNPTSGPLAPDGVPYFAPSLLLEIQEPVFDEETQ